MTRISSYILSTALVLSALQGAAVAQMDNRPFSFKNSPAGGVGMSVGGREAILNDKLFGAQPRNLVRDQNGALLEIVEGPGNTAIARMPGTEMLIPSYRGTSFTGGNPAMAVGIFNGFFVPRPADQEFCCNAANLSGAAVSTWTARVVSGGVGVSYNGDSLVDIWTGQVFTLGYYE